MVNACNSYNSGTKRIRISENTNALDEFYANEISILSHPVIFVTPSRMLI
jgi:hypothetical protein